MEGLISKVKPHSPAAAAGIVAGEKLLAMNGQPVKDILDVSFAAAENNVQLQLKDKAGNTRTFSLDKDPDEDLGLEFETAVFDGIRRCANHCKFCFVDQMIPGLRSSLYVRDDDYRLSFLYGNFITLTNMGSRDFQDIRDRHLSPLYVSVHTTNGLLRAQMMGNRQASQIMEKLRELLDTGVTIHAQIVCCPGYNDGEELSKTYHDLRTLAPGIATMAVVPVGLTKNRQNLTVMRTFTAAEAKSIVLQVTQWQQECRSSLGKSFIYLGDEFYLLADQALPPASWYDGFPQLENGIGLSRNFLEEWVQASKVKAPAAPVTFVIPVGVSAAKVLQPLISQFNQEAHTDHRLLPVDNKFFGNKVTVTGLLTGQDILAAIKNIPAAYHILVPKVVLNHEQLFLDDMTWADFQELAQHPVRTAATGADLYHALTVI